MSSTPIILLLRYMYISLIELIGKGYTILLLMRSYFEIMTVHAPHPPSEQPSLVPHSLTAQQLRRTV